MAGELFEEEEEPGEAGADIHIRVVECNIGVNYIVTATWRSELGEELTAGYAVEGDRLDLSSVFNEIEEALRWNGLEGCEIVKRCDED